MSETASDIIRDALTELTVQSQEQTIPAVEFNTAIRYLNRMMASLDAKGIKLGYTKVDSPNDPITVPAGAIEGIVFNLALRLAGGYDIPVSPSLALAANDGMRTLRIIGVMPPKSRFPNNLPIGSGNDGFRGAFSDQRFFNDPCEDGQRTASVNDGDRNGL